MNLVIDLGNSRIVFAFYDGYKLIRTSTLKTIHDYTINDYRLLFKEIDFNSVEKVILGSVVPSLTTIIRELVEEFIGKECCLAKNFSYETNVKIFNYDELGVDLLASLIAVDKIGIFPSLIIDLGSASKYLVIDKNNAFIGCIIAPGLETSLKSLYTSIRHLPEIEITKPMNVIETTTKTCIQSGVINGTIAMVEGLVKMIEEELGYDLEVILTGGCSEYLKGNLKYRHLKDLVTDGLNILLQEGIKNEK